MLIYADDIENLRRRGTKQVPDAAYAMESKLGKTTGEIINGLLQNSKILLPTRVEETKHDLCWKSGS